MQAKTFNRGRPYPGSELVAHGGLRGAADTDYFYFFCPSCSGEQIMRVLEYGVRHEEPANRYDEDLKSTSSHGFVLAFKLHCEECTHTDFVKISNLGWQGGSFADIPSMHGAANSPNRGQAG